jgi:sugar lactone lactonase YvrE
MLQPSFFRSAIGRALSRRSRANPQAQLSRSAGFRPQIEALEDRSVPTASISVADATINEIGSPSAFVATGSGGLDAPYGITLGSDGNVYVASSGGAVLRYSGTTGQSLGTFVTQGSGGLSDVYGLTFGPDGNLYVASGATDEVLCYNGTTGAFMNAFVAAGSGGLDYPRGVTFGADGNLYVSSSNTHAILRYQGPMAASPGAPLPASGQTGATFVAPSSGGLYSPLQLIFGPDGNLYADGGFMPGVARYDGATGAFLNTFVPNSLDGLAAGRGMAFDQEGRFYVGDSYNAVRQYDAQGNFLADLLVNAVSTPLSKPHGMIFDSQGALVITCADSDTIVRYDRGVSVSLSAASSMAVTVDYSTADGSAVSTTDYYAKSGTIRFEPGQTSRRILLASRDDLDIEPNQTFSVLLSNATGGATIGIDSAMITVTDDDATRQVSIADTSAVEGDHTAHYRGDFIQGIPGVGFNEVEFGPDGNLYAGYGGGSAMSIDRYDGTTGAFLNRVVTEGRVKAARDIAFRDGYLYVCSENTHEVLRYNASSGAFVDAFVTAGSGGLANPHGITFGPDANSDGVPELYVSGRLSFNVVRYDGATGAPLGTYVTSGSGELTYPQGITFDPSGTFLYVTFPGGDRVLKYNAQTGAYVGVGAIGNGMTNPRCVKFGPADGLLYVSDGEQHRILRFNASGTYVDDYVPAGAGGMSAPNRMSFGPDGDLYIGAAGSRILRFGTQNEAVFTVSLSTPSTLPVTLSYATGNGAAVAGNDYTATNGTLTFAPGSTSATIRVPILDLDTTPESVETFTLHISNVDAATIADGQGVATVLDNDSTKFYVVNDGSFDQNYRYGAPGNALGSSALNSGNTAPRGAVSTAAGTTVWVVDANKKVYVYNASGGLLGSWTAGGLNGAAQLEGIATNGTDIWLVDNKQDKVFKYAGAASRLSGSQNAASSFNLNSDNTNSKDIVTDGTSLWVVNDSTTDKVFKYTVAGALLGSWTIAAANSSPTGITLDPSNVAHLWIVDSGTDKIYQYDNAATRTSGSQVASATFVLAAGNTNPQGIADPPPHASQQSPSSTTVLDRVFAQDFESWPDLQSILDAMQDGTQGRKRGIFTRSRGSR